MSAKTKKPRREKRKQQAKWAAKRADRSARRWGKPQPEDRGEPAVLELNDFEVTNEPMADPKEHYLPPAVRKRLETLTAECIGEGRSAEHLEELQALVEQYPQVRRLHNYLAIAYERAGQPERAKQCVEHMYRQFPNYVFAMNNYVRHCLREGDVAEAGRVLDQRYLITQFARDRKRFHVSEVIAYQGAVAEYLNATGQTEGAWSQLAMLQDLDPDHPQVRRLAAKLSF